MKKKIVIEQDYFEKEIKAIHPMTRPNEKPVYDLVPSKELPIEKIRNLLKAVKEFAPEGLSIYSMNCKGEGFYQFTPFISKKKLDFIGGMTSFPFSEYFLFVYDIEAKEFYQKEMHFGRVRLIKID